MDTEVISWDGVGMAPEALLGFFRYQAKQAKFRWSVERMTHLKNLFKGAALSASTRPGPLYDFYVALLEKGMRPTMARLTVARKDCHHHFNDVEERSGFRRPTIASASSLSVSRNEAFPSLTILSGGSRSGSQDARFEVSISQ